MENSVGHAVLKSSRFALLSLLLPIGGCAMMHPASDTATPPADATPMPVVPAPVGSGNASAQNGLGMAFYEGNGVPQNYLKAASYFQSAAQQGDVNAEYMLATMYMSGKGVGQSDTSAD